MLERKGLKLIAHYEGCSLTAYLCPAGVWTIGYGRTKGVKKGMTQTQAEADADLEEGYDEFEREVLKLLKRPVNENELGALTCFAYNVGIGNLKSSTLLKKVNANDPSAVNEFLKWDKARVGGKLTVLPGLVKRRRSEAELFASTEGIKQS